MKRDYIEFQERSVALAYFITFRTYGTWFHGDVRGSVDRRHFNRHGTPGIVPNAEKQLVERDLMKAEPMKLDPEKRSVVEKAIRSVCDFRRCTLFGLNVRTNHAHIVVANCGSVERMMNTFKAYSTRALREAELVDEGKVWSRHGSTRYLWTERHIEVAVDYVINGQGDELPSFDGLGDIGPVS